MFVILPSESLVTPSIFVALIKRAFIEPLSSCSNNGTPPTKPDSSCTTFTLTLLLLSIFRVSATILLSAGFGSSAEPRFTSPKSTKPPSKVKAPIVCDTSELVAFFLASPTVAVLFFANFSVACVNASVLSPAKLSFALVSSTSPSKVPPVFVPALKPTSVCPALVLSPLK